MDPNSESSSGTSSSASRAPANSTRNAPPQLGTGLKIAGVCTAAVTLGLAIPLVLAKRRSGASSASSSTALSRASNAPSGISPSVLLRQSQRQPASSSSSASTTIRASPNLSPSPSLLSFASSSGNTASKASKKPKQPASPDAILFAIRALGAATGIVTLSAGVMVVGFRWWTGIASVAEFTPYMQQKLSHILPAALASRLDPKDDPNDLIFPSSSSPPSSSLSPSSNSIDPTAEAERRMQAAYAEGGVVAFGQQMWAEFEREWDEASKEREGIKARRRGDSVDGDSSGNAPTPDAA